MLHWCFSSSRPFPARWLINLHSVNVDLRGGSGSVGVVVCLRCLGGTGVLSALERVAQRCAPCCRYVTVSGGCDKTVIASFCRRSALPSFPPLSPRLLFSSLFPTTPRPTPWRGEKRGSTQRCVYSPCPPVRWGLQTAASSGGSRCRTGVEKRSSRPSDGGRDCSPVPEDAALTARWKDSTVGATAGSWLAQVWVQTSTSEGARRKQTK